jgi:phosphoglucosamine mutase
MRSENKPLSVLRRIMTVYPQVLINVKVSSKPEIESLPEVMTAIKKVESELGQKGRVLVRYSGTQPLCRIMVEGPDEESTRQYCIQLSDIINNNIGSGGG